jgi:glutamyl-tRNA synthetase
VMPALAQIRDGLKVCEWNKEAIHQVIVDTAEKLDMKLGKIAQPVRVAVTGDTVSPSIDITLQLLGRDEVVQRLTAISS